MAARTLLSLHGIIEGIAGGSSHINPTDIQLTSPIQHVLEIILANGFNAITVPAGATGFIYIPDPLCTSTKTLKGITGDTGLSLSNTKWSVINFGTPPASFGIASSALETKKITIIFF